MSSISLRAGCALAALLTLQACGQKIADPSTQYGAHPQLPAPHQYLMPPMRVPPGSGWSKGQTPVVPAGLQIRAFATGFKHPRSVYSLPNGDVLVVESNGPKSPIYRPKDYVEGKVKALAGSAAPAGNRIILLRDTNGDGVADLRTVFIDHLNSPFGLVLVGSDLYVAATDAILKFPYAPGETHITAPGVKITDLPAGPINHHWTKSLTASPDGSKLYVGVGSNSNITENGLAVELGRAAIWEVDRATGLKRIFASGTRNPTGVAFEPQTGKLWAIVNERDEIGPNLVPDYLTSVKENGFYGWPYSYFGPHVDVRVQPGRPDLVAKAIAPDYALSSHVAPLGMVFTAASSLPAYRSGVFVGEHGSWDRSPLNGYKVVYVPFRDGRPSGPPQDVVTGFLSADGAHSRGRPVGVTLDHTGALLIADDVGNVVWRVSPAGA
ncbi:sorbosone dehydrogenase family protein [Phenylobacterium hankyongense]|uniref:Sorbosone dehydrogenase family protein n=1 Tax=Phenylobacterium hankyongense TaxID=1813876 RepID=A0A328B8I7_9CAUL|nr:sorbosone dehydrogenase family protein [Phenylobacterium hankyongense]RAK61298.1 sorbosone dehydrogenase family protein [Phenylobacterium hankyongense]